MIANGTVPSVLLHDAAKLKDGVLLGDLLKRLDPDLNLTGFNRRVLSRKPALANLEIVLGAVWRKSALGLQTFSLCVCQNSSPSRSRIAWR
jgi:hypothetical protein